MADRFAVATGAPDHIKAVALRAAEQLDGDVSAYLVLAPDVATLESGVDLDAPAICTTTAGQFTHRGRCDDEVVVVALGDVMACGELVSDFHEPSTAWSAESTRLEARREGRSNSLTVAMTDGLSTSGEHVVAALRRHTKAHHPLVGGAAGDFGRFEATRVALNQESTKTGAAALHLFDKHPWGIGLGHGLVSATKPMLVTKAEGIRLYEIENRPALEAYEDFARSRGVTLTPKNRGEYMIRHEIGIMLFGELRQARAPLLVHSDGSITCAAPVPVGSNVCILDGEAEGMVRAARQAAVDAKAGLQGRRAAGVIVFDCVCRGMLLDTAFDREIAAVRSVFEDAPLAGYLTYGEIARFGGRIEGWHNTTAVVVAVPEA
ncbi:MAG: FIST N-terminal domain-containing protein [Myxococcota bacterium]